MDQNLIYETLPVRLTTDDNEQTWFAGVDVCNILGYADTTQAISKLDDDEKKLDRVFHGSGQQRRTWTVNESGLYSLIITSSKPEAKAFKKWITSEVLPSIRKAGKYTNEDEKQHDADIQTVLKEIETVESELKAKRGGVSELKNRQAVLKAKLIALLKRDKSQLSLPFPKK